MQSQAMTMALRWTLARESASSASSVVLRKFGLAASAAGATNPREAGDVPPGHKESDLSPTACNIGLGRRRDLTLRQDLCLWKDGKPVGLSEVLKGKKVILVGFPGGPVCLDKHLPSYVQMADKLHNHGVDKVVAVTVDTPEAVQKMASQNNLKCSKVDLVADKNGGLIRLLGCELGSSAVSDQPKCQRFAAIIEDGILLKLRVEKNPGEVQVSDCKSMLQLWESVYPKA